MSSYQQLQDDVCRWLNRRDIISLIPGWVAMVETQLNETLRHRCMLTQGTQPLDAPYITMPPDFATMASIRDARTGEMLELEDEWSGHWTADYIPNGWQYYDIRRNVNAPCTAYRLVGQGCVEFLPHPIIPDPPDPSWQPQQVLMVWYAKPTPLVLPSDTNNVLDQLYSCYLFGVLKMGATFELDGDRAAQMDALWKEAVTQANTYKQQSDYSGAPFRSILATVF